MWQLPASPASKSLKWTSIVAFTPIPSELPAATCTGANTIGCYVDTVLFVANYFPNLSSWGARTAEGGVRAFIEEPGEKRIQIIAVHPIRPQEIDARTMRLDIWYYFDVDSIGDISFNYSGNEFEYTVSHNHLVPTEFPQFDLNYDPDNSALCGTISFAKLAERFPNDIGSPSVHDTLRLKDLRLDLPVFQGRY